MRGELLVGQVALFLWLADEVLRRDPERTKPLVFLSDGDPALHEHQGEFLPAGAVGILDLFHVLEYLWKAAWCFFDEASEKERAEEWVEAKLRALLEGRVASVIRGLRVLATRRGLRGQPRKTVEQVTGYLERNRERMKYDEYLAAGYPIGSGVVEGACRHLVKDRLERAGMRWRRQGRRRCWTFERPTSTASGRRSGPTIWRRKTTGSMGNSGRLDKDYTIVTPDSDVAPWLDPKDYPKGLKVRPEEKARVRLRPRRVLYQ